MRSPKAAWVPGAGSRPGRASGRTRPWSGRSRRVAAIQGRPPRVAVGALLRDPLRTDRVVRGEGLFDRLVDQLLLTLLQVLTSSTITRRGCGSGFDLCRG